MAEYPHPSKERVERNGYLVYAEGDEIPETDIEELERQGYLKPKADKVAAKKAPAKKSAAKG